MMALPRKLKNWNKFIKWFSAHEAYWYFPKGRTINPDDIIESFRILKRYEGEVWKDVQASFLDDLSNAGHFNRKGKNQSNADSTAMARVWKVVFSMLGFAWVKDNDNVAITVAGNEFLTTNNPSELIQNQVQRYQISNPTTTETSKQIQLRPHVFLLNVLLGSDSFITHQEYILFVSRARGNDDLNLILEFIKNWRKLTEKERDIIYSEAEKCIGNLPNRRSSLVNTIKLGKSYALSFLSFCSYLEKGDKDDKNIAVKLNKKGKNIAKELVKKSQKETVFVDYKNAKDWFSYYGVPDKMPTKEEAIDYYIDTSQVEKLESIGYSVEAQIQERILEDHLEKNLDALEEGLTLVGRQYSTITGPIDLLCRDKDDNFVVVELKKGRASDKVIGQITRYMGFIKTQMIEFPKQLVRGIIVGQEIDKSLEMSLVIVNAGADVSARTFSAQITIHAPANT